jgi:hypothetical protein
MGLATAGLATAGLGGVATVFAGAATAFAAGTLAGGVLTGKTFGAAAFVDLSFDGNGLPLASGALATAFFVPVLGDALVAALDTGRFASVFPAMSPPEPMLDEI